MNLRFGLIIFSAMFLLLSCQLQTVRSDGAGADSDKKEKVETLSFLEPKNIEAKKNESAQNDTKEDLKKSVDSKVAAEAKMTSDTSVSQPISDEKIQHAVEQVKESAALKSEPVAPAKEEHHRHAGEVTAEKSLGWLKNGNRRFVRGRLRNDGQSKKDIERLSKGQKPHAIVLSCSDSRVPPEIVFDQKLGEIFVVRSAGETLDYATVASIEYAVEHLGSNLIVVMGHESCGAVKAAVTSQPGQDIGSASLNQLVAQIRPRVLISQPFSEGFIREGWENVDGVAKDLLQQSEIVRSAVQSGEVKISKALYHLGNGEVEWK